MIDDSGDRKDGARTAHVGHQWLGRYGKTDNGVVTVTTVWADERIYYPVHAVPYTPADAARALAWDGPDDRGDWQPVTRTFRDGHTQTWWAADADAGLVGAGRRPAAWWWRPPTRAPGRARPPGTWSPTCPARRPARRRQRPPRRAPGRDRADLRDPALDRAELQAGQGRAGLGRFPGPLRYRDPPPPGAGQLRVQLLLGRLVRRSSGTAPACGTAARTRPRREGGRTPPSPRQRRPWPRALRAIRAWLSPWIALQRWWPAWSSAPATAAAGPDQLGRGRLRPAPLHPELTNYR